MKKWIWQISVLILVTLGFVTTVFAAGAPKYEEVISYIYIESPELLVGQTQKIGIILSEEIEADQLKLVYESQTTKKQFAVSMTKKEDQAVAFAIQSGEVEDTYQIVELIYEDSDGKQRVSIKDRQFAFSVRKEMHDVVAVDIPNGEEGLTAITQRHIAAAVSEGLEKTAAMIETPVLYSTDQEKKSIVIALDAGHDSTHAGAAANGINEEIVTLKLAQYAKEELETYEGVTVHMTRTGAECPNPDTIGSSSSSDIKRRIDAAIAVGAQAVISFHLNSFTTSSPKGCLVLCPKGTDSIAVDALQLSKDILEKLCAVGFENDGTRQEDWTITTYSKEKGIPGIIIEHGFITNPEDSEKLKDEAYVRAMGIADAQGIAEFYGLEKKKTVEVLPLENRMHVGSGEYYIQSAQKETITLDIKDDSVREATHACIDEKKGTLSQSFSIKHLENGYYQILDQNSGLAIGVCENSQDNNLQIWQSAWTGADEQLWEFEATQDGYCYIRSKLGTYLTRVEADSPMGGNVVAYEKLDMEKQGWIVKAFSEEKEKMPFLKKKGYVASVFRTDEVSEGIFLIRAEMAGGVLSGSSATSTDSLMVLMEDGYSGNQQWSVIAVDGTYYRFMNIASSEALSIEQKADGTTVVTERTWNHEESQLWEFLINEDGRYYIRARSGDYLGVSGGVVSLMSDMEKQTWTLCSKNCAIMGKSTTSVSQMAKYYNRKHEDTYPTEIMQLGGAADIYEFCQIIMEEAVAEGVRAEVVFSQVILETGWLSFTGSVRPEWYNFCGLGAVDSDPAGGAAHFLDVREGIRAQVQHLKAYASKEALNNECVDPRFELVKRGCSPYVQWLGTKDNPNGYGWATGQGYGNKLLTLLYALQEC